MIFTRLAPPREQRSGLSTPQRWLVELMGGAATASGQRVNPDNALTVGAVFACVRVISEAVASLPVILYEKQERGRRRAEGHPVFALLHDQPNPDMTATTFFETCQSHIETWGNAYAQIVRAAGSKRPLELWPLSPNRVRPERLVNGEIVYQYRDENNDEITLASEDVLHVPGLGFDGIVGYSPVHQARQTIGGAMAAEKFAGSFYGNGSKPGGVLEYPGRLAEDDIERVRKSWSEKYQGAENAGKTAVLEQGMTYKPLSIPPEQAQFLETRRFSVEEVARWFNVPPSKIGDNSHATFNNVEQFQLSFIQDTIRPKLVKWEQEIRRKLIPARSPLFAEFMIEGALRADIKTRYEAYSRARQWGWLSVDDVRERDNLNPLPDGLGNIYLTPANMVDSQKLLESPEPEVPTEPPQPPEDQDGDDDPGDDADAEPRALDRVLRASSETLRAAFGRSLKVESEKIARAMRNGKDVAGWLDRFYDRRVEDVESILMGPVGMVASSCDAVMGRPDGGDGAAIEIVREAARGCCRRGRADIVDLTDVGHAADRVQDRAIDETDRLLGLIRARLGITHEVTP